MENLELNTQNFAPHSGLLVGMEDQLDENSFVNFHIGVSQSEYLKTAYVVNWNFGYRFHVSDHFRPNVQLGFGYQFGYYKEEMFRASWKEDNRIFDHFVTTILKVGFIDWEIFKTQTPPIHLMANLGIQGLFPDYKITKWQPLLEVGLAYRFRGEQHDY